VGDEGTQTSEKCGSVGMMGECGRDVAAWDVLARALVSCSEFLHGSCMRKFGGEHMRLS
jgi:hypothetical protein